MTTLFSGSRRLRPPIRTWLCLLAALLFSGSLGAQVTNVTQGTSHLTIQAAIDAATPGDSIFISNGTYPLSSTLEVDRSVVLHGESMAGVVLDASAMTPLTERVVESDADDITFRNLTIKPIADPDPFANNNIGFTLKLGANSVPTVNANLVLENITIDGAAERTPFDFHGLDGVTLTNITANGTTRGNGMQFTGCTDVVVNSFNGMDNAWGSIAIYASGTSIFNRGSDNVTINGSGLSINGLVYHQDDYSPTDSLFNTNITVTGFDFLLHNDAFRSGGDGPEYIHYLPDESTAVAVAKLFNTFNGGNTASALFELSSGHWVVGDTMFVQAAIDEADAADVVDVRAGTFQENLLVDKALDLRGPNYNAACGARSAEAVLAPGSGLPIQVTADGVSINGFEITAPSYQYAIVCGNTSDLGVLFNNIHDINSSATPALTNTHAIQYTVGNSPSAASNVAIEDNCFTDIGSANLTGNSASAIGFLQSTTTGTLTNLSIQRNTITDVVVNNSPWPTGKIAYGILLNAGGGGGYLSTTGKIVDATIADNALSGISGHIATGIGLEGNSEDAVVTGNDVSNLSATKSAARSGGGLDLQALKFENNRYVGDATVTNNRFAAETFTHDGTPGLGYAIANYVPVGAAYTGGTTGAATASCNWMGDDEAGEIADNASLDGRVLTKTGAVIEVPDFLTNGTDDDGSTIGFQLVPGSCNGVAPVTNVTQSTTHLTIQSAVDAANPGDSIYAQTGTYVEDVVIGTQVILQGAGPDSSTISGPMGGGFATLDLNAAGTTVRGFAITREGNNPTDWDSGLNSAGISIQSAGNMIVEDCSFYGNRTGIDINNSNGNRIAGNLIDNNRTGMLLRNQTDNSVVVDNAITNNWTMGILFLDASGGSNSPLQQALGSQFNNNAITGNWYGGVVDRQTGGSLPAPGDNPKDFTGNWWGTIYPVIDVVPSAEPGYSSLIPVAFGGTATNPGGAPDILGEASANIEFCPVLDTVPELGSPVSGLAITCPANITAETGADSCGAVVSVGQPELMGCDSVTLTNDYTGTDDASGYYPEGTTTVVWTATDAFGSVTCSMTVTVVDGGGPSVTCPADIMVDADSGQCAAVVEFDPATAFDLGYAESFEDPGYATGGPTGWNDYTSPLTRVLSGTGGITSSDGAAHGLIDATASTSFTGAFGRLGGYQTSFNEGFRVYLDVYMDLADPAVVADTYGWDLSVAGSRQDNSHLRDFIFHTASNASGEILVGVSNNTNFTRRNDIASLNHYAITSSGWYTYEWVFRDSSGSLAVDLNLLDAGDNTLWTETRYNAGDLIASIVGGNRYMWFTFLEVDELAIDNNRVERVLTPVLSAASGDSFPVGNTTVTATATDACGNTDTCSFTITVNDAEAPMAICQDITVYLDASGNASITGADIDGGSTDNCSVDSLMASPASFTVANQGANTVILTVMDAAGNADTCSATVTVVDTVGPTMVCQDVTIYLDGSGLASLEAADVDGGSTDAVGIDTLLLDVYTFNCSGLTVPSPGEVELLAEDFESDGNGTRYTASLPFNDGTSDHWNRTDGSDIANVSGAYSGASNSSFWAAEDTDDNGGNENDEQSLVLNAVSTAGYSSLMVKGLFAAGNENGPGASAYDALDHLKVQYSTDGGGSWDDGIWFSYENHGDAFNEPIGLDADFDGEADVNGTDRLSTAFTEYGFAIPGSPATVQLRVLLSADAASEELAFDNLRILGTSAGGGGGNTVTLTGVDLNGNSASCTAEVSVLDTIAPMAVCASPTLALDANGNLVVDPADVDGGSTDNCGITTMSVSPNTFTCADAGTQTVTLTVEDASGNSSSCTTTITIVDDEQPNAVCQNITVALNASGMATITPAMVDGGSTDNCAITEFSLSKSSFDCSNLGPNNVIFSVRDDALNAEACVAVVTVIDTVAPDVVCQDITVYLDASGNANITAGDIDNGSSDACSSVTLGLDINSFTCADVGPNSVVLTATDVLGNSASCTATVTVVDTVAPVAVCQDITVYLDASGNAAIASGDIDNGSSDACGIASTSLDVSSFTCAEVGANTVNLTATDNNGNSSTCSATVTVIDTIAPMAVCQDITVFLDASGNASIAAADVDGGASDACGIATRSVDISSFSCADVGANTVNLTVTDNNGNSSTCSALVTVIDTIAPVAVCQDITVYLDASGNASITAGDIDNGSSDACGIASLGLDMQSFTCAEVGANTVNLTATDANGKTSSCSATVTVVDTIAPVAICQDITVYLDGSGNAAILPGDIDNGSSDACGIASTSLDVSSFTCAEVGANAVNLTVTDNNGNSSACSATVTVIDTIAPMAVCQDITVFLDASGNASIAAADVDGGSSDACGIASLSVDNSSFSCANVGANTVNLTVTDNNGNSSSCSALVTVIDTIAPVAVCQNIDVYLDASGNASIVSGDVDNGSSDACGIASTTVDVSSFTCANVGANTVILTVTDANGNSSSCSATVTVIDTVAPMASCQDITVYLDGSGNAAILPGDIDNGSSDACGVSSTSLDVSSFDCSDVGANAVNLTVTDNNGNSSTCSATVTVLDTLAPTLVCPGDVVLNAAPGVCNATYTWIEPVGSDNCSVTTFRTAGPAPGSSFAVGVTTITYTAFDVNGNSTACSFTVTVTDTTAPAISCPPDILINNDPGVCGAVVFFPDPTFSDACAGATLTQTGGLPSGSVFPVGINTVTYTATDLSGNSSSCSFTVEVVDSEAPTVSSCPTNLTLAGNPSICGAVVNYIPPVPADNCPGVSIALTNGFGPGAIFPIGTTVEEYTVTDAAGNVTICSFVVTVTYTNSPTLSFVVTDESVAGANDGAIDLTITGGLPPFSLVWSNSSTMEDISGLSAGTYVVTVFDNNGCAFTDSATVAPGLCIPPATLVSTPINPIRVTVAWSSIPGALLYQARGRPLGTSGWPRFFTADTTRTVSSLIPGGSYEWQVRVQCGDQSVSGWSVLDTFHLPSPRIPDTGDLMAVFPNPVDQLLRAEYTSQEAQTVRILLTDALGRVMMARQQDLPKGKTVLEFNSSDLAEGMYTLSVEKPDGVVMHHRVSVFHR